MLGLERRTSTVQHTITEEMVGLFGQLSGDLNPLHFDNEFAERTRFGGRIVHGMLYTSFVSEALYKLGLSDECVIFGDLYVRFIEAVRIGDTITARATMIGMDKIMHVVECELTNQKNEIVSRCKTKVLIEKLKEKKTKLQVVSQTDAAEQVA